METYIQYFSEKYDQYLNLLGQHLLLCLLTLVLAFLIGFSMGMLTLRMPRLYLAVNVLFQGLRIIPSLAVLAFLIPVLGIGTRPAVVALTILGIPPILLQTALGFHQLEPALLEAAQGMGMGQRDIFWKIRLPLVLPYVFTGLKTATSEIMASITLAAYIGAGGMGVIILSGISLMKTEYLVIGGGTVAVLTLLGNLLWDFIEKQTLRYQKR